MTRTNLTSEIDSALAGRNAGARGFWEVARSGNGDMTTDLLAEDGADYEELEGLGETTEELEADEAANGFKPYRAPKAGEKPPYAPKPGKAWIRRRMAMNARKAGGNAMVRCRWVMVSPAKWEQLKREGKIKNNVLLDGLGAIGISKTNLMYMGAGAAVLLIATQMMRKKRVVI
jgi:hypothetical protein